MGLAVNTTVLRNNALGDSGIAQYLLDSENIPMQYLAGNRFSGTGSDKTYYTLENFGSILANVVYDKSPASDYARNLTQKATIAQIINGTDVLAAFDSLSSMIAETFRPLSNIRYSKFRFLKNINGRYTMFEEYGNIYCTSAAILDINENDGTRGDREVNSRIVFDRNSFVEYENDTKNQIIALRNSLVKTEYQAKNPPLIQLSTVNKLIDICLKQANRIRHEMSCYFGENGAPGSDDKVTVTYYKTNSGGNSNSRESYKYDYETILSYSQAFPKTSDSGFRGWTTIGNSSTINYIPGNEVLLLNNLNLYPVFGHKVTYTSPINFTLKSTAQINAVKRNNYIVGRNIEENSVVEIFETNKRDLVLATPSQYFNGKSVAAGHTFSFLGWKKQGSNKNVDYVWDGSSSIVNSNLVATTDYTLYPVGLDNWNMGLYKSKVVDIKLKNERHFYNGRNDDPTDFEVIIPINDNIVFNKGSELQAPGDSYDPTPSPNKLEWNTIDKSKVIIKQICINTKNSANTKHTGNYTIQIYQNGGNPKYTISKNFRAAETAGNQDNFGTNNRPWTFTSGQFDNLDYKFNYTTTTTGTLADKDTYIKISGRTGYSTDNKNGNYTYRARFLLTVTYSEIGTVIV